MGWGPAEVDVTARPFSPALPAALVATPLSFTVFYVIFTTFATVGVDSDRMRSVDMQGGLAVEKALAVVTCLIISRMKLACVVLCLHPALQLDLADFPAWY